MMATTHALAGAALAALVAVAAPDLALPAFAAGVTGGVLPDLDVYAGHRRALHYPVYATAAVAPAVLLAVLHPAAWTVAPAVLLAAVALHARMDAYGGGLELRPWEADSERAVYDHYRGRWVRPRRWVRYDGAPEDVLLAAALAAPALLAFGATTTAGGVVFALVGLSLLWAGVRRRVPALVASALPFVPDRFRPYVPERFADGTDRLADGAD